MDSSFSLPDIPRQLNRAEELAWEEQEKHTRRVEQEIAELSIDDDDVEFDSSESENEEDSRSSSSSRHAESSMRNANFSEADGQVGNYPDNSSECYSNDECDHSFQTQATSVVPSAFQSGIPAVNGYSSFSNHGHNILTSEIPDVNGHSSFIGHKKHNIRTSEISDVNGHSSSSSHERDNMLQDRTSDIAHVNGHSSFSDHQRRNMLTDENPDGQSFVDYQRRNMILDRSCGDHKKVVNGSLSTDEDSSKFEEKYRKFKLLYKHTIEELKAVKNATKSAENKVYLLNEENEQLKSHLQATESSLSDFESKNKDLLSQVESLEFNLADVIKDRDEARTKLESSEITVKSLEMELKELQKSDYLSRKQDQQNRIIEDLKKRHQKEVLQYKEKIDELQNLLKLKMSDNETLSGRYSEMLQKCEKLQQDKNNLYDQMEKNREKFDKYLQIDKVEEANLLNLKVQQLQEENLHMKSQINTLNDEIKSLKVELNTAEMLQKLAFSTKPKENQETHDERQKELNLQVELENSLKNVQTLRTENCDLKKQLKDNENYLAKIIEKIDCYEIQLKESEKKKIDLEEKLRHLTANESVSVTFHEKQIKSLESELQLSKNNCHELTKKLKEATSSEKFLRKNNEDLQTKISEMMQKFSEEKLKSVEECRQKYLHLHEDILSKKDKLLAEKDNIIAKSEKELKDACTMYENKIAEMQVENSALSDQLKELKTKTISVYQENQNLKTKFQDNKPTDRNEIEKAVESEYETKLKQVKEVLLKQTNEYLEKTKIEWTKQKMNEIKQYIENQKQCLDDVFKNCLQKERNNFQQQLELEKEKQESEYNQKLKVLQMQISQDQLEKDTQLKQDMQSKWLKEIAVLKDRHEKEIVQIQQHFENKLSLAEKELNILKEKASMTSKPNEEFEKMKQEFFQNQRLLETEKAQLLNTLTDNLKASSETEKHLRRKLLKYERHTAAIKKKNKEDINKLQCRIDELEKSCEEKQNQIRSIRSRSEQQLAELGEIFRKQKMISTSFGTQTEDDLISKQATLNIEAKFFGCLENISDEVRKYVIQSKKRYVDKLEASLKLYHQQMYSKHLQGISNDLRSFTPTIVIPRVTKSSSKNNVKDTVTSSLDFHNGLFTTSTPGLLDPPNKQHSGINFIRTSVPERCNSSPNLQTKPKLDPSQNTYSNYFSAIYKNCASSADVMGHGDFAKQAKSKDLCNGEEIDIDDISYDFTSEKSPTRGLFGNSSNYREAGNFQKYSLQGQGTA